MTILLYILTFILPLLSISTSLIMGISRPFAFFGKLFFLVPFGVAMGVWILINRIWELVEGDSIPIGLLLIMLIFWIPYTIDQRNKMISIVYVGTIAEVSA